MADFCSLCGYGDMDIDAVLKELYVDRKEIVKMDNGSIYQKGLGICEHCGIVSIGIDRHFNVRGYYFEGENKGEHLGTIYQGDFKIDKESNKWKSVLTELRKYH
jgi:hypothetical protein